MAKTTVTVNRGSSTNNVVYMPDQKNPGSRAAVIHSSLPLSVATQLAERMDIGPFRVMNLHGRLSSRFSRCLKCMYYFPDYNLFVLSRNRITAKLFLTFQFRGSPPPYRRNCLPLYLFSALESRGRSEPGERLSHSSQERKRQPSARSD